MRYGEINRKTTETDISLKLNIDGSGKNEINTGCGFLDHMLSLFAKHGRFDLTVKCSGDTNVDYHHTVEDVGICLGQAFFEALGDKKGVNRYGFNILPMDESLVLTSVDFSGRDYLGYSLCVPTEKVGDLDTELIEEFWLAFVRNAKCALHIKKLDGINSHHIIEAAFKSTARSIMSACEINDKYSNEVMSTKGVL